MSRMNFTIGADPEFFIAKKGKVFPAYDVVPGTKDKPHNIENGAMQVDGLALEVNINPVSLAYSSAQFNTRLVSVIKQTKIEAEKKIGTCSIMKDSVAFFDEKTLECLPDSAKELGCDPDYSAYTCEHNPRPDGDVLFRVTGGHVHVGWNNSNDNPVEDPAYIELCADFVKVLDFFLGVPLKILDRDDRRREMYGKAGAFRPKGYGVEYRSPSSWWIHSKASRVAVYELVGFAVDSLSRYGTSEKLFSAYGTTAERVQSIIDGKDNAEEAYKFYAGHLRYSSKTCDALVEAAKKKGF